jgi:hypothetical protein
MMRKLAGALALAGMSVAARAAPDGSMMDEAGVWGLAALGLSVVLVFRLAARERRRERDPQGPVRMKVRARRYNQP